MNLHRFPVAKNRESAAVIRDLTTPIMTAHLGPHWVPCSTPTGVSLVRALPVSCEQQIEWLGNRGRGRMCLRRAECGTFPIPRGATLMPSKPVPSEDELLDKIRSLPPERVAEVADFVDFLRSRDLERGLTHSATRVSEAAFAKVWNNPDDADYDQL